MVKYTKQLEPSFSLPAQNLTELVQNSLSGSRDLFWSDVTGTIEFLLQQFFRKSAFGFQLIGLNYLWSLGNYSTTVSDLT